ncbi:hypothetical protein [Pseudohoeflea coraliihabitans]|uniref:Uncharacterized protein n=1 Tax=Pseudohoeflea coraliihabitans TaxID=2860393 RepID=A0ABS6WI78_9HYPH|nr:hypothetical protein [Pseudohoeflea sp. DP4N28-3]MBW3095657.1 hypothetical protein [Pseudohoeflea sp. DP4N28-3]
MVELGCRGLPDEALQQAVADVASGEHIEGRRKGWAPSPDVFANHARYVHECNEVIRRARERMKLSPPEPREAPIEAAMKRLTDAQAAELKAERQKVLARFSKESG